MRSLPPFATKDRTFGAVLVVGLGIAQALCLAVAAFATRDAFAALQDDVLLSAATIAALAVSGALGAVFLLLARRQAEALGQSYAIDLRHVLYAQIAQLPKSRHEQRRTGALSLRFVGDLSAARLWFGHGLPDVLTAIVVFPGAVAILFALDPVLALCALSGLWLAITIMVGTAWRLEQRHRRLRKRRANIAIAMIERIAVAPELDLMGRTDKELRALDEQGRALRQDAVARRGRTAALQAILQIGVAMSGLAILWVSSRNGTAPAIVAATLSVLALVSLPLQEMGAAWDRFCAWRVAREKAQRLLDEPTVERNKHAQMSSEEITVRGRIGDEDITLSFQQGTKSMLAVRHARQLARIIAGLDLAENLEVRFGDMTAQPRVAFIGDMHIGLQGSLRRSVTLSTRKRPTDSAIGQVLSDFGLGELLANPRGLDQRITENGQGLSASETLRLDLARAVLGEAEVLMIASQRWSVEIAKDHLIATAQKHRPITVIVADARDYSKSYDETKVE